MTDLKPNDHARLRRALRFIDDQAPLGPDLPALEVTVSTAERPRGFNPALVVVGALLATLMVFVPIGLLVSGEDPAEPGSDRAPTTLSEAPPVLARDGNWTVEIWQDGSEICYRTSVDNPDQRTVSTGSQGCQTPSSFSIPDVLNVFVAALYESNTLTYEEILGLVTERADRLVITFESGDTMELEPGDKVRHGYRGFGVTDLDAPRLGEPTTIEVFDGETSLGTYSHQQGKPIS
jgi:hypothetical protein